MNVRNAYAACPVSLQEVAIPHVDGYVVNDPRLARIQEKHKIACAKVASRHIAAHMSLILGCTRQVDAYALEDILREGRAVERVRLACFCTELVRCAQVVFPDADDAVRTGGCCGRCLHG